MNRNGEVGNRLSVFYGAPMTVIPTARLVLRPPDAGDTDALVRGLNNLNVSRWTARIPFPYERKDAEAFLSICAASRPGTLRLAITREGDVIGVISYEATSTGGICELGYWLAESWWGKGFGREAARAMTDHAFESAGYAAMTACYRHGNMASKRILEGLGFVQTGDETGSSLAVEGPTRLARLHLPKAAWIWAKGRR